MKLVFVFVSFLFSSLLTALNAQSCSEKLVCEKVTVAQPMLDGDFAEWSNYPSEEVYVQLKDIYGRVYAHGDLGARCVYDNENIYFAFEVPGNFRFDIDDNHLCASIGTMFKVGVDATFVNMGGCPDALVGCAEDGSVPDTCSTYMVDLGAHWELKTTEQGASYDLSRTVAGSGDDPVANLDDEYAVSPSCRPDDNGPNAGNEWSGAWVYDDAIDNDGGVYRFELSRLLRTDDNMKDVQLQAGETYSFGVAFWDPFENSSTGWTKAGHYLTGCANQWMDLELL